MIINLYHKQCTHCGLNYFGKTVNDPEKYYGSGSYWLRHINKHGRKYVATKQLFSFEDQEEATAFALKFSRENNIVESNEWANLQEENAVDGASPGYIASEEHRKNNSLARKGKPSLNKGKKQNLSEESRNSLVYHGIKNWQNKSDEDKEKFIYSSKGKIWIRNFQTGEQKRIFEENLDEYIVNGFVRGKDNSHNKYKKGPQRNEFGKFKSNG